MITAVASVLGRIFGSITAYAGTVADPNEVNIPKAALGFTPPKFGDLLTFVIRTLFIFGGLAALLYLILGAFAWITSGGDKENVAKAREKIQAAVIGLILIVGVLAIVSLMENLLFPSGSGLGITRPIKFQRLIKDITPGASD